MSLPAPKPGLVIRYSFLWSDAHADGAEEGAEDRPCAIVAPITQRPPRDPAASIAIPPATCRSLGLDDGRHWLRLDELNRFAWPGYDLRAIPGRPGRYDYGMLPPRLFERLRTGILARQKMRATRVVRRDRQ